ncbi:MAG: Carbohydrate-binding CenC domain protein, partial [Parcubacteria group bacterium GW2011_GWA2_42_18]
MKNKDKIKFMKITTLVVIGLAFIVLPAMALAATPLITDTEAINMTDTTVDLTGQINSNGSANIKAWYEFDVNTLGVQTVTSDPGVVDLSSYTLTGLIPNTNYSFRVSVINSLGQLVNGPLFSFTTLPGVSAPTIVSTTYGSVDTDRATFEGVINPNNSTNVRVWFELNSTNYGLQIITTGGISNVTLAPAVVTGLSPSTAYSFRIVAINDLGQLTNGTTVSFTTASSGGGGGSTSPSIVSATTTSISTDRVTLNGTVNPNSYT